MLDTAYEPTDALTRQRENDAPGGPIPRSWVVFESTSTRRGRIARACATSLFGLSLVVGAAGCDGRTGSGFAAASADPSGATAQDVSSSSSPAVAGLAPLGSLTPTFEARSIDGAGNNLALPDAGRADVALLRLSYADYGDGASTPAGATRPSARAISNEVHAQEHPVVNRLGASDLFWSWGQFVDHDLDLTTSADPHEPLPIEVPRGDPFFDPAGLGGQTIPLNRSLYVQGGAPRQQRNQITAWIDGSMIYGSDPARQAALRANDGTGRLRVDDSDGLGDLLPRGGGGAFLAGDVRVNENVLLTSMHTLWVREHNRVAALYRQRHPGASGDEVYELARRWVGAEVQAITYEEWLPLLLGRAGLPPYAGYDATRPAGVYNEFSAACFRFGHSLLSDQLLRLDGCLRPLQAGPLALRDAFERPDRLLEGGIEPLLRGAAHQTCQELDARVVDGVRNFLFGAPGAGGLDLVSLNIQRGRDHGLPSYNEVRRALGLTPRADFDEVCSDPRVWTALRRVYARVDDVDLWTGTVSEDHVHGGMAGELLSAVLRRQFGELRDHDRFFYRSQFTGAELAELRATRLGDVIRRNTPIGAELQATSVFLAGPPSHAHGPPWVMARPDHP